LSFRRGFKAEANRIAVRVRERMGLRSIDPIDPIAVCAHFDIELMSIGELECDCSAFFGKSSAVFSAVTVPRGIKTAIAHNNSHHIYRQRSNICHELAHNFLGHKHTPPLTSDGERNRDSGIEGEANFLAGVLLITNEATRHIVMNGLNEEAQHVYGVSRPMLTFRLRVSGANRIAQRILASNSASREIA
jgi:IrrE N-terminal-like domain